MYRVRNNRKRWRMKWPWRVLFPLRVDQRFCRECGFPYHEGPLPQELNRYRDGNVEALLLPAGSFRSRECVLRFGRWKVAGSKFFLSEFIPESEIASLQEVIQKARDDYEARTRTRGARR